MIPEGNHTKSPITNMPTSNKATAATAASMTTVTSVASTQYISLGTNGTSPNTTTSHVAGKENITIMKKG